MHLVDIDIVGLQAAQRIIALLENSLARGIALNPARCPVNANLGREQYLAPLPVLEQGFAYDFLGTPSP